MGRQATAATNLSGYFATSSAISSLAIRDSSAASLGPTTFSTGGLPRVSTCTISGYWSIILNLASKSVRVGIASIQTLPKKPPGTFL
ncbi:hypothetical protein ES703_48541 [subsurface metagenome]